MQLPDEVQKWRRLGKCTQLTFKQMDDLFFFGAGGSPVKARTFCASCPVKRQCLHFAILHNQVGVWAGTTEDERKELVETGIVDRIIEQGLIPYQIFASPDPERSNPETDEETPGFLDPQLTGSDFPIASPMAS